MSTVVIVSDTHHQKELDLAIRRPFIREFQMVGITTNQESEARKEELKRKVKSIRFLTRGCSQEVLAVNTMSGHHWDAPYFLLIHSLNGVRIAKELSAGLGHENIADAVVIAPATALVVNIERRMDGILFVRGSFQNEVIKSSIVESLIRFANKEPAMSLRLDSSSVHPKPLSVFPMFTAQSN